MPITESELIDRLIASDDYRSLQVLRPDFNFFNLLDDALREPAWSRIFSGILDSTLTHGLGSVAFFEWMDLVSAEARAAGSELPGFFHELPRDAVIRLSANEI